jgi:hypothetical protein
LSGGGHCPSQTMTRIPRDIWLYIADFIPDSDLEDLLTLNSVFFDLAMTARYKMVTLLVDGLTLAVGAQKLLRLQ